MLLKPDKLLKVPAGHGLMLNTEDPSGQKKPAGQSLPEMDPDPLGQ
jgi:hypothetical protein